MYKLLYDTNEHKHIKIRHKFGSLEVTQALKQMKNNKTPGINSISAS